MESKLQQLFNDISKKGVLYASMSVDKLKQKSTITMSGRKQHKSLLINNILINEFGSDNINKFNNISRVMQDYYGQQTRLKLRQ